MTRHDLSEMLSGISSTTEQLLKQSQGRVDDSDGQNLGLVTSHLALTAARDALKALDRLLLLQANADQLSGLAAIATRIGDAARAAFAAGDADAPGKESKGAIRSMAVAASCTFCGKSETERPRMVHGPGVAICDECVERSRVILGGEPSGGDAA